MEIDIRWPRVRWPKVKYFHVSVALDIVAAGLGVLGGAANAMLAVQSKRGIETFVRKSTSKVQEWRGAEKPELASVDDYETESEPQSYWAAPPPSAYEYEPPSGNATTGRSAAGHGPSEYRDHRGVPLRFPY